MRKTSYILLGLLLLVGAVGAASWRHVIEPTRSISGSTNYDRVAPSSQSDRSATRSLSRERTTTTSQVSTWDMVDLVVNVLNVVIGIVGIWLAISGMRMQRDAAAAQSRAHAIQIAGRER